MDITELKTVLGDELFTQVQTKVQGLENLRLINTSDGKWIPKNRFDAERQSNKDLQTQIEALNTQITEHTQSAEQAASAYKTQLEKLEKTVKERDAKIGELTAGITERETRIGSLSEDIKNRDTQIAGLNADISRRDAEITGMHREAGIRRALEKHHPKDTDLVMKLLDTSKITEDESGKLTGLDEQIEALKKDSGYLFGRAYSPRGGFQEGEKTNPPRTGGNADVNAVIRGACGR